MNGSRKPTQVIKEPWVICIYIFDRLTLPNLQYWDRNIIRVVYWNSIKLIPVKLTLLNITWICHKINCTSLSKEWWNLWITCVFRYPTPADKMIFIDIANQLAAAFRYRNACELLSWIKPTEARFIPRWSIKLMTLNIQPWSQLAYPFG